MVPAPLGQRDVNTLHARSVASGSSSLLMKKQGQVRASNSPRPRPVELPPTPPSTRASLYGSDDAAVSVGSPPESPARAHAFSSRPLFFPAPSSSPPATSTPLTPARAKDFISKRTRPVLSPAVRVGDEHGPSPNPRQKKKADSKKTPVRGALKDWRGGQEHAVDTCVDAHDSDDYDDESEGSNDGEGPEDSFDAPHRKGFGLVGSRATVKVANLLSPKTGEMASLSQNSTTFSQDSSSDNSGLRRSSRQTKPSHGKGLPPALAPVSQSVQSVNAETSSSILKPRRGAAPPSSQVHSRKGRTSASVSPPEGRARISLSQPLPDTSTRIARKPVPRASSSQPTATPLRKLVLNGKRGSISTAKKPAPISEAERLSPFVPRPASPTDDPLLLKGLDDEEQIDRGYSEDSRPIDDTFAGLRLRGTAEDLEEEQISELPVPEAYPEDCLEEAFDAESADDSAADMSGLVEHCVSESTTALRPMRASHLPSATEDVYSQHVQTAPKTSSWADGDRLDVIGSVDENGMDDWGCFDAAAPAADSDDDDDANVDGLQERTSLPVASADALIAPEGLLTTDESISEPPSEEVLDVHVQLEHPASEDRPADEEAMEQASEEAGSSLDASEECLSEASAESIEVSPPAAIKLAGRAELERSDVIDEDSSGKSRAEKLEGSETGEDTNQGSQQPGSPLYLAVDRTIADYSKSYGGRDHSILQPGCDRSIMHALPRSTAIVEVMSTNPEAAARAAALLRTHHKWIHEGCLITDEDGDGEASRTFNGKILDGQTQEKEDALNSDETLSTLLKAAEAQLRREEVRAREGLNGHGQQDPPAVEQSTAISSPRAPGGYTFSPVASPVATSTANASGKSQFQGLLESDSTHFPREAWKALDRCFRRAVRDLASDQGTRPATLLQRRLAARVLKRESVVSIFIADHCLDASLLQQRWSKRNLLKSVQALQRQWFLQLEQRFPGCLTAEEATMAEKPLSSFASSFCSTPLMSQLSHDFSIATPASFIDNLSMQKPRDVGMMQSTPLGRKHQPGTSSTGYAPSPIASEAGDADSDLDADAEEVEKSVIIAPASVKPMPKRLSFGYSFVERSSILLRSRLSSVFGPSSTSKRATYVEPVHEVLLRDGNERTEASEQDAEVSIPLSQASTEPETEETTAHEDEREGTVTSSDLRSTSVRPASIYPPLPTPDACIPAPPPEPTAADLSSFITSALGSSSQARENSQSAEDGTFSTSHSASQSISPDVSRASDSSFAEQAVSVATRMRASRQINLASTWKPRTDERKVTRMSPRRMARFDGSLTRDNDESNRSIDISTLNLLPPARRAMVHQSSETSLSKSRSSLTASLLPSASSLYLNSADASSSNNTASRSSGSYRSTSHFSLSNRQGSSFVQPTVLAGLSPSSHTLAKEKARDFERRRREGRWLSPRQNRSLVVSAAAAVAARRGDAKENARP